MKAAPVLEALGKYAALSQVLVHTGQHYDTNMSEVFFEQLGLPRPGKASERIAEVIIKSFS